MKQQITQDQFEDVLYNPSLVVVQKEHTFGKEEHWTWVYVYEAVGDEFPSETYVRVITAAGTTYHIED